MNAESTETTEMSAHVADLQRQASTLIALKSKKGPSTLEAKQRVKYNALRHGFTGQVLIMTPEEREHFDAFVKGMMTDLAPANTHETFLANSMAEEAWRLNQIRARCANLDSRLAISMAPRRQLPRPMENQNPGIETDALETAVIDTVVARDHAKELALMSLYAQRTQRAYEKYRKELNEVQQKRKTDEATQLEEARLLFQLADTQGAANPKQEGFVFLCAPSSGLQTEGLPPQAHPTRRTEGDATERRTISPKSPPHSRQSSIM